jgi:glycosyltransferase involved in cell wall biosynthesis
MNVLCNYTSESRVLRKLNNTDYEYIKNMRGLTSIDTSISVTLNESFLSAAAYDFGYYMQRVQQRSGVPLPFWKWLRKNVIIPPTAAQDVDVIFSRNLVPRQLGSSTPVVYETNFVSKDYAGVSSDVERSDGIEHELRKLRTSDAYMLKTRGAVDRFVEAVRTVTGEDVRDAVHYVPYFLPEIEPIDSEILNEKFSRSRPIRILFVGSDGERKGVHSLIEALNRIHAQHPKLRSAFTATIVTRTELPHCAFNVDTHDHLPHEDVIDIFRRSHVFCMPTLKDSYGLVYIEAMASGCAVVADDSPVRREILDDGNAGLLSDPQDPGDIAEKLLTLIQSPEYACTIAKRARQRFRDHYHWRCVGQKYVNLLREASASKA